MGYFKGAGSYLDCDLNIRIRAAHKKTAPFTGKSIPWRESSSRQTALPLTSRLELLELSQQGQPHRFTNGFFDSRINYKN